MRHDPAAGAIVIMLRSLKMYGISLQLFGSGAPSKTRQTTERTSLYFGPLS